MEEFKVLITFQSDGKTYETIATMVEAIQLELNEHIIIVSIKVYDEHAT